MTKRILKKYPNDFKQEEAALLPEQGYSVVEAAGWYCQVNKLTQKHAIFGA